MIRSYLNDKLLLTEPNIITAPVDPALHREFSIRDSRGIFSVFLRDEIFRYAECVQSAQNAIRGNHYHRQTVECLFIAQGSLRCVFEDVQTGEKVEFTVGEGHKITIKPNIAHAFFSVTASMLFAVHQCDPLSDRHSYIVSFENKAK